MKQSAKSLRKGDGKPASIRAKMNALIDPGIIDTLYRASQDGVEIDLVVRGTCCLHPDLTGLAGMLRHYSTKK